jgi:hypothetical protein
MLTPQEQRMLAAARERDGRNASRVHEPPDLPAGFSAVRCPKIGRLPAVLLGLPVAVWCHWNESSQRSYPCLAGYCGCNPRHPRRLWAFVAAQTGPGGAQSVLSLTPPCVWDILAVEPDLERWRGVSLWLERVGGKVSSRVRASVLKVRREEAVMPPEFAADLVLLDWWRADYPVDEHPPCWDWPFDVEAAQLPGTLPLCREGGCA